MNLRKFFLLIVLTTTAVTAATAQTLKWDQHYGGLDLDEAYGITAAPDSGYVITGFTSSSGSGGNDLLLLKINEDGVQKWSVTFGGTNHDWGMDVIPTTDSNLIAVGFTSSFSITPQIYLIKITPGGAFLWGRIYGGLAAEYGYGVVEADDGGFVIVGETYSYGAGANDLFLVKIDAGGSQLWMKSYGGAGAEWGESIAKTPDGGYIITGCTNSFGNGNYDVYLLRVDANGDSLWARTYGSSTFEGGRTVIPIQAGGFIIGGITNRSLIDGDDAYLIGVDTAGSLQWETIIGGSGSQGINDLQELPNGRILAAGETSLSGFGGKDFLLLEFSSTGDSLAAETYGASSDEEARAIVSVGDEGVVMAGYTRSFGSQSQVYVTRVDHDFLCGDADGDGTITIGDIVFLIAYIFGGGPPSFPLKASDPDCSGEINIADIVYLISYIFGGGPAPCLTCEPPA